MAVFKRTIRFFLFIVGVTAAFVAAAAALLVRLITTPPRQALWGTPADVGLAGEPVHFPARDDGVRLAGWLVKAAESDETRPAVILVHDWGWNRLGLAAAEPAAGLLQLENVDLLRLTHALVDAGFHVLMFDLRNHGESAGVSGTTFGYRESLDLLGAVDFLAGRPDVGNVGVLGFGIGGNATLYALTRQRRNRGIQAAVVVQPIDPYDYLLGLSRDLIGPLNQLVVPLANGVTSWLGSPPPAAVNPLFAAAGGPDIPLVFYQAAADVWGSVETVQGMAAAAPGTVDMVVTTTGSHRFAGFNHVVDRPEPVIDFFNKHLG